MNKILVIWDIILDKYSIGEIKNFNPESTAPLIKISDSKYYLWWAANLAANIAFYSWGCDLIWNLWEDINGDMLKIMCNTYWVNLIEVNSPTWNTIVKERFIDKHTNHHLFRADYEDYIEFLNFDGLIKKIDLSRYAYIVISDYNKGYISNDIKNLMKHLKIYTHITVYIDTKKINLAIFGKWVNFKVNIREFNNICANYRIPSELNIKEKIKNITKMTEGDFIVTLGKSWYIGYSYRDDLFVSGDGYVNNPIIDTIGAGDTFLASMITELYKWWSFEKSLIIGNRIAGESIQKQRIFTYNRY